MEEGSRGHHSDLVSGQGMSMGGVIDARIKCTSGVAIIVDLGLRLERGDVVDIPEASAQSSQDLWKLQRIGQVSVRWITRCREMKDKPPKLPAPPFIRLSRNKKKPPRTAPKEQTGTSVDSEALAKRIRAEVREEMGELKALLASMLDASSQPQPEPEVQQAQLPEGFSDAVKNAVQQAVGSMPRVAGTTSSGTVGEAMPMFIPAKILNPETKGEIDVKSESSEDNAVDEASQALRSMKKKRSKKSRKKT